MSCWLFFPQDIQDIIISYSIYKKKHMRQKCQQSTNCHQFFCESVVIHCLITLKKCCASTRCRLSGFYINSLTMLRDLWRDLSPVGRQLKKVQGSQMRVKMGRKHWTNPKIYDPFCLYFCLINILVSFSYQAFKITSLNIERHSNISTR